MGLPLKPRSIDSIETQVVLVTRQFGGGSCARIVDGDMWLRSAAVRGALRFWWRALHVHHCTTPRELRDREEALFGSSGGDMKRAGPGRVGVTVVLNESAKDNDLVEWKSEPGDALSGAYFPAQPLNNPPARLLVPRRELSASIRLTFRGLKEPEQREEVRTALVAYLIFGGSGARTRRAAGALCFTSSAEARKLGAPYDEASLRAWLGNLPRGEVKLPVFSVANRHGVYLSPKSSSSGEGAQRQLLEMWREFRQQRKHPQRWIGSAGWGQTSWPEADAIRLVTGKHAEWEDGTSHSPKVENRGSAPRGHLGLPIVVKFKDDSLTKWNKTTGRDEPVRHPVRGRLLNPEPTSSELIGVTSTDKTFDRYASPVMLSVVRIADGGASAFCGLVLVTPSRLTEKVVIRHNAHEQFSPGPWNAVREKLDVRLRASGFTKVD